MHCVLENNNNTGLTWLKGLSIDQRKEQLLKKIGLLGLFNDKRKSRRCDHTLQTLRTGRAELGRRRSVVETLRRICKIANYLT